MRRVTEGRYPLMVWPYHAMLGSVGHALVSAVAGVVGLATLATTILVFLLSLRQRSRERETLSKIGGSPGSIRGWWSRDRPKPERVGPVGR